MTAAATPTVSDKPAGSDKTAPALAFSRLPLPAAQLANLETLGYLAMTPVQAASLPAALDGKDLIVQAATGSGKTAAFALALLAGIERNSAIDLAAKPFALQALVLCPTRELIR
jgi:ATP-independent RNA helicase DbpA